MSEESKSIPAKLATRRVVVGWHEWIALPEIGVERIAAKLDTGARTSALHARDIVRVQVDGKDFAEFTPPLLRHQRDLSRWEKGGVRRERAELIDERIVRSSNGEEEHRWVVRTKMILANLEFFGELSLTDRTGMRFPMLLGRTALGRHFLIDPGRGHLAAREARLRAKLIAEK